MHIDDQTRIEMARGSLTVCWADTSQVVRLGEAEALREAAQRFVVALVEAESATLFGHLCSRCGECCRREDVLVTCQEIFRLARHVGVSDARFGEEYLRPADSTWSAGDGFLRTVVRGSETAGGRRETGGCILLESSPDGRSTRCSAYDVRPFSCRAFMATSPICIKDPEKLVEQLAQIRLEGSRVTVTTVEHAEHVLDVGARSWAPALSAFLAQLALQEDLREDKFSRIASGLKRILKSLRDDLAADPLSRTAQRRFNEARGVAEDLNSSMMLTADASRHAAVMEEVWSLVAEMDGLIARGELEADWADEVRDGLASAPPSEGNGRALVAISVYSELTVATLVEGSSSWEAPLHYADHATLTPLARDLMAALARWDSPEIAAALEDQDPPCFRCGECCRVYAVEIVPSDIARLAWNLGLSERDFVERWTVPGRFSWNPGARVLKKVEYQGRKQCVFLEHREDGFFYCGVHLFKPGICGAYPPTARLCRRTNDASYWGRRIRNCIWLSIEGCEARLCTYQTHREQSPPLSIDLRRRPEVLAAGTRLAEEAARRLDATFSSGKWADTR